MAYYTSIVVDVIGPTVTYFGASRRTLYNICVLLTCFNL